MIIEKVEFDLGCYETPCQLFKDVKIGSVLCVGHPDLKGIKKCEYCVSYKEENSYYLPIMKETIKIVSEVTCNRPAPSQLSLF